VTQQGVTEREAQLNALLVDDFDAEELIPYVHAENAGAVRHERDGYGSR